MTFDLASVEQDAEIRPPYRAFLLRCWQEETNGEPTWRFTLEHLGGERIRRGFACLEDVTGYLRMELASPGGSPAGGG